MGATEIITFGCRLNACESDGIRAAAAAAGLADAIIVNTCAVTLEAERQARQAIRRARREHPEARIIVTGCAATIAPERFHALPEIDHVLANDRKLDMASYAAFARPAAPAMPVPNAPPRARAYLQVQQGCDHRCTFCIIPYARGPSRSLPIGILAERARSLLAAGAREIVLTGVDLTAYGADLPGAPRLGDMVRDLLAQVPELERLRLSSLDPGEIDEALWDVLARETRLMPHFHLSAQAGDDLILKRMKRRHTRAEILAVARRARALRPEIALGADLIAGFPTETEEMFGRSLDLIAESGIAFVHAFPYSPRPGTPAARMPQNAPALARERARRLREAGVRALAADLVPRIGGESEVLIERPGRGRTEFYAEIGFAEAVAPGKLCRMRLVGHAAGSLIGEMLA